MSYTGPPSAEALQASEGDAELALAKGCSHRLEQAEREDRDERAGCRAIDRRL